MPAALAQELSPEKKPAMDRRLHPTLEEAEAEQRRPSRSRSRAWRSDDAADDAASAEAASGGAASRAVATREERITAEIESTEHVPIEVGEALPPAELLAEAPQRH